MKNARTTPFTRFLHRYAAARDDDAELLRRYAQFRDEEAFEALVRRHDSVVWGVCRRVLGDTPDAEDAFQATFIVLARKAGSIARPEQLANWLYGVAYRTSLKARVIVVRRRVREEPLTDRPIEERTPEFLWTDVRPILDDEINRLPEKYRSAFVLCYLAGRTNEEAAQILRCPTGTVASRLASARERLRRNLTRRGLVISAGLVTSIIETVADAAGLPTNGSYACWKTTLATKSGPAHSLAEGVLHAMSLTRLRYSVTVAALVLTVAGLAGGFTLRALADKPSAQSPATPPRAAGPVDTILAPAFGKGFATIAVTTDLQRRLIEHADNTSSAVVLVDGVAVFDDASKLDPATIDMAGMDKALAAFKPVSSKAVHFIVYYGPPPNPSNNGTRLFRLALEGIGREAKFGRATSSQTWSNSYRDWNDRIAGLKESGQDASSDEPAEGDETARAYAVKTPLSRMLTDGAECYIDVRPKLDLGLENPLPANVEKSILAAVGRLKMAPGAKAHFSFRSKKPFSNNSTDRLRAIALKLSEQLGLELKSFTEG
jgi:RNA polymerase sigma factor (sigma-70 family)